MPHRPDPFLPWSVGLLVESVTNPPTAHCSGRVPHWVMGLTLTGVCDHRTSTGERLVVRRGDVHLVRPGTTQSWKVSGRETWRTIYAVFDPRPHWLPWLDWAETVPGYARLSFGESAMARRIGNVLSQALTAYQSGRGDAVDRAYHAVEGALLLCREQRLAQRPEVGDPRLDCARELLASDLAGKLSLGEVARRSHLSRTQLALRFKAQTGQAPIAFRTRQRIERAMALLRVPYLQVKRVAREVGFLDPRAFSTCFRRITGDTPRSYRRRCTDTGADSASARDAVKHRRHGR